MYCTTLIFFTVLSVLVSNVDGHFHESLLPKGWGDVQRLRLIVTDQDDVSIRRNNLHMFNAAVVDNVDDVRESDQTTTSTVSDTQTDLPIPTSTTTTTTTTTIKNTNTISESETESGLIFEEGNVESLSSKTSTKVEKNNTQSTMIQFVWKVYNITSILQSGQELMYSPRFYLSEDPSSTIGYRMQLLLVTNTTYLDNISYLGVFFRIVPGDNDSTQEWPYKFRTVLSILDHDQLSNHLVDEQTEKLNSTTQETYINEPIKYAEWNYTVIPNIDECRLRSAFLRPNSESDTGANTDGCGNRRHIPLNLIKNGNRFTRDDTLLVLVTVHLTDPVTDYNEFRRATMSMRYNELISNYVWTIDQFSHKERDSINAGRISILTSNPFYTHPNGYLIQMFMTLLPKRNAFAISIAFVQGDHDRYLQWPFPYSFEMAIVDQSPDYWKRDLTVKVKPSKSDCGTESFGQPGQQPEFCFLTIQSLQVLSLTHYNFLINDTLKIRFTTRFERYSARQRSSILLHNGRLVSEFNWFIPGLVARFERYIQESSNTPYGASSPTSSASSATRRSHRFVSDEFYTNGQGYLCQLVLTVTVRNVPLDERTKPVQPIDEILNKSNPYPELNLSRLYAHRKQLSQDILVFGLELVIIEGEYDRFLEWPFTNAYELSIVGYKNLPGSGGSSSSGSSSLGDITETVGGDGGGQMYSVGTPPHFNKDEQQTTNGESKKTSSSLLIPTQQVINGQCSKESFQKPIERNPPCGVREFVQLASTEESRRHRHSKQESANQQQQQPQATFNSATGNMELGTLNGKSEEDLHLRVRIYL
ncbi:hypothetical protein BLOT_008055 [Blomia tropicalis]|nr:hypothetical protein BLOT_008055 [Blomia tropicalis]